MKPSLFSLLILGPALMAAEPSLQSQLDARSAEAAKNGDPAVRAEYAKGIEAVAASGILDNAKKNGDKAPDFTLKSATGKEAGDSKLPLAATYIIKTDGTIHWAFLDADYRKRAEPSEIVDILKEMRE
jgi:hypothetical protein